MKYLILVTLAIFAAGLANGCVPATPNTPYPSLQMKDAKTGSQYTLYVPSYYTKDRSWPLVIPLHGTFAFDSPDWQVTAWKDVAERRGLIVASPPLRSVQGILPVVKEARFKDLESDEKTILSLIDDVATKYNVDKNAVLLTGFSAGGFPMYYVGLRNPERFNMLIAAAANSSLDIFDRVPITPQMQSLHVAVFFGKDDMKAIQDQSWQAFRWLRDHKNLAVRQEIKGGHLRRPEVSYALWAKHLPAQYKQQD